jgi:imidazolonepropionase
MSRRTLRNARLITMDGHVQACRGRDLDDLRVIARGWIGIDGDRIAAVEPGEPTAEWRSAPSLDAHGRIAMPGFVDCHTHACWAGERYGEWAMKLAGRPYHEILAAGGGILSTVRAVRASSRESLAHGLVGRLREMLALGTTTAEVKSGYGLSTEHETMMLDAIGDAAARSAMRIMPTFLGAHAIDPDVPDFIGRTIGETIPAVAARWPGICADLYCERAAWGLEDSLAYARAAHDAGMPLRMHVDQFTDLGMVPHAIALGARTCDHLEATSDDHLLALARSNTMGVALPGSPFCLGGPFMRARAFLEAGGALAIATNRNPGSSPVSSMAFAVALAVRHMGLTYAQALWAATWNAACALGVQDRCGALREGMDADIVLWPHTDERALAFDVAGPAPDLVLARGALAAAAIPSDTVALDLR